MVNVPRPPSCGSNSERPMNQESVPGPVEMASQISSGLAGTSASKWSSNSRGMSLLGRHVWVYRDDDAVVAASVGGLVVIARDQVADHAGELFGEGGPVGRRGEPYLRVDAEGGDALAGLG